MIRKWRYLTSENPKLSKLSMIFIPVIFAISLIYLMSNSCYLDNINCVRWNPSGDMLASASCDTTIALLDFKTGKALYTESISWRGNFLPFPPLSHFHWIIRFCYICLLYLRKTQISLSSPQMAIKRNWKHNYNNEDLRAYSILLYMSGLHNVILPTSQKANQVGSKKKI